MGLVWKKMNCWTWVREEDGPVISTEVMELDFAMGGFDFKVRKCVSDCKAWHFPSDQNSHNARTRIYGDDKFGFVWFGFWYFNSVRHWSTWFCATEIIKRLHLLAWTERGMLLRLGHLFAWSWNTSHSLWLFILIIIIII